MAAVLITKEFSFEMAHALTGSNGECANIHGHSYKLSVTVTGKVNNKKNHPSEGMIIDFSELKKIILKSVIHEYDHALVVSEASGILTDLKEHKFRIIETQFQPTSENLVIEFSNKIIRALPKSIFLVHLKLRETSTSFVEWTNS